MSNFWMKSTTNLIQKIEKEINRNPNKRYYEVFLEFKEEIIKLAYVVKNSAAFKCFKENNENYCIDLKKQIIKEKVKLPIYWIAYLDMLNKLKKSPTSFHSCGVILTVLPAISKFLEEKDGKIKK